MELGASSISLAVKDISASTAFYEKLGYRAFAGDMSRNWLILKNGAHVIGLFQGMFEKNTLTFNPGWDSNAQKLDAFTDVRELQKQLKGQGVSYRGYFDEGEARAEAAKLDSAARETYTLFKIRIVQNKPLPDSWALGAAQTSGRAS